MHVCGRISIELGDSRRLSSMQMESRGRSWSFLSGAYSAWYFGGEEDVKTRCAKSPRGISIYCILLPIYILHVKPEEIEQAMDMVLKAAAPRARASSEA